MSFVIGMDGNIYYNTSGVAGSGSWVLLDDVTDVTTNLETAEADVTTRSNNGWTATAATLKDASIEFEMVWAPGDTGFEAIKDAYMAGDVIGIAAYDGLIGDSGSQGLKADMNVMSFTRTEPLTEAMKVSVTLKPTFSATAPEWDEIP